MKSKFNHYLRTSINAQAEKISSRHGPRIAGWIFLLPDLLALATRLTLDPRVSLRRKVLLGVALFYIASPLDLLPEGMVGPVEFLDDLAVLVLALKKMKESSELPETFKDCWSGQDDLLD